MLKQSAIVLILCGLCACEDARTPSTPDVGARAAYIVTEPAGQRLEILLGRVGIIDELPEIRTGGSVGEKWTLVSMSQEVIPLDASAGEIDLSRPGTRISHEFDGQKLNGPADAVAWYRFDYDTEVGKTSGRLAFDRGGRGGVAGNGASLDATFEGQADVYQRGELTYFKLEILTGAPFASQ